MSALMVLGVGLLGGLGAAGRFLIDGAVAERVGRDFPYGTLALPEADRVPRGARPRW